jgi:hypothetical protein
MKKASALLLLAAGLGLVTGCGSDSKPVAEPTQKPGTTSVATSNGPGDKAFCDRWEKALSDIPLEISLSAEQRAGVRRTILALAEGAPGEVKDSLVSMAELYRPEADGPLSDDAQRKADEGTQTYTKWVEAHCDIMGSWGN